MSFDKLCGWFTDQGPTIVAFSGGVDSTLLLAAAVFALGDRTLAVTARSASLPEEELDLAVQLAKSLRARHRIIDTHEDQDAEYRANKTSRCFVCKHTLFSALGKIASDEGFGTIVEGTTLDDLSDYRPGMVAAKNLGIRAPLIELGIDKTSVRKLAMANGLKNWDKPSTPCLASRVAYGEPITPERLDRIAKAERILRTHGFNSVRLRDHGVIARIEVDPTQIDRLWDTALRQQILAPIKALGFTYVTVDLDGYRTGAMNELLSATERQYPLHKISAKQPA